MTLILRSDKTITALPPGTPALPPAEIVLTSDTFSRPDTTELVGTTTDAALGGQPATWVGDAGRASLKDATMILAGGATNYQGVGLPVTSPDHFIRATVLKTAGIWFSLIARRAHMGSADRLILQVNTNGLTLIERGANQPWPGTTIGTHPRVLAPGDEIGLYVQGTEVKASLNGEFILTAHTTFTGTGFVAFAPGNSTPTTFDNVVAGNLP